MFGFSQPTVYFKEESEDECDLKLSESEFEKFLNNIDLASYLDADENVGFPNLNPDKILGNQIDIYNLLKESVYHQNELLEKVGQKIFEMDEKIEYYRYYIFGDDKRISKIKGNKFLLKKGSEEDDIISVDGDSPKSLEDRKEPQAANYLSADEVEDKIKKNEAKALAFKSKQGAVMSTGTRKTLEDLMYLGFDENELTDFPGFVEAPQLLNNLSLKMGFKPSFLKYWTQIIRSDASIAILLDSFWWFYIKHFRKEPKMLNDAYKFFCRISESFASLLFNIDSSIRDRFFGQYADFLAQAIYSAFYHIFPDSRLQFNDNFKQEICNTVYEWVLGIRPIPENYLNWKINDDISFAGPKETKIATNSEKKMLNSLGEKDREPVVKFNEEKARRIGTRQETRSSQEFNKNMDLFYLKQKNESHVLGEGSHVEKISFNLKGKSVLISHYIKMHNLKATDDSGFKMTRSEIIRQPARTAPTYRDFIYQSLERAKSMGEELNKKSRETENEIKKLEKQRKKTVSDFLRLKRSASSGNVSAASKKSTQSNVIIIRSSSTETLNRMELIETDEENF